MNATLRMLPVTLLLAAACVMSHEPAGIEPAGGAAPAGDAEHAADESGSAVEADEASASCGRLPELPMCGDARGTPRTFVGAMDEIPEGPATLERTSTTSEGVVLDIATAAGTKALHVAVLSMYLLALPPGTPLLVERDGLGLSLRRDDGFLLARLLRLESGALPDELFVEGARFGLVPSCHWMWDLAYDCPDMPMEVLGLDVGTGFALPGESAEVELSDGTYGVRHLSAQQHIRGAAYACAPCAVELPAILEADVAVLDAPR